MNQPTNQAQNNQAQADTSGKAVARPSLRKKARRYALQGIYQWQLSGSPIAEIEMQFLETMKHAKVDIEYFREILVNTLSSVSQLDENLIPYMERDMSEVNPVELAVLRLACYELSERMDVPYRVVINEALELTKTFGAEEGHRFINGVLDKLAKKLRPLEAKS